MASRLRSLFAVHSGVTPRRVLAALTLAAAMAPAARPAGATTYVPVADEALVDQAALIVLGRVVERRSATGGPPATEYVFAVERAVRGRAAAELVVRVPGGVRPGGPGLKIWGAPSFGVGERTLLFLAPARGGGHAVLHLSLGAFRVVDSLGRPAVLRDLSEMQEARLRGGRLESLPSRADRVRDLDLFLRWIADRAAGRARPADYLVRLPEPELRRLTDAFTLFEFDGLNLRWFEFDGGGAIALSAHENGQDGVAGGGFTEFQTALTAWNDEPKSRIAYTYGGTTTADGGFLFDDGVNAILFNDPNEEVDDFSCAAGGILALGGPWFGSTEVFRGASYWRIVEADVITNDGLSCFFASSPDGGKAAEELFAHELGHTLGIGHSCGDGGSGPCDSGEKVDAVMRAFIHDDGRGARLGSDDGNAARSLYPGPASFFTVTPCRVLDTRNPPGPLGGPALTSGSIRTFPVGGVCGVPFTALAVAVNVTVTGASGIGHLTAFPADQARPPTSTINFAPGQTRANNAVIALSGGTFPALAVSPVVADGGQVHLIVDVNGYFR